MPIKDFSPTTAADKLAELYSSPDAALYAEARLITTNFVNWLKTNFNFTTKQYGYITSMSPAYSLHLGGIIGAAALPAGQLSSAFLRTMDHLAEPSR